MYLEHSKDALLWICHATLPLRRGAPELLRTLITCHSGRIQSLYIDFGFENIPWLGALSEEIKTSALTNVYLRGLPSSRGFYSVVLHATPNFNIDLRSFGYDMTTSPCGKWLSDEVLSGLRLLKVQTTAAFLQNGSQGKFQVSLVACRRLEILEISWNIPEPLPIQAFSSVGVHTRLSYNRDDNDD